MRMRHLGILGLFSAGLLLAAEPARPPENPPPEVSADDIYAAGKDLFDSLAPPEVKEFFEFPDRAQWDAFAGRLQSALEGESLEALAQFEPEARAALIALRTLPGYEEYLDWLEERLDYIEAAKQTVVRPPPPPPPVRPVQFIPSYDLWLQRVKTRPRPAGAAQLIPGLQAVFSSVGVNPALVWLAEVESTFNPSARSPAGARGLFQLMPATAKELGLSIFMPDERTNPEKSADAAARMLRQLHRKFQDWPLALAAYNAGPGRVQRTLDKHTAKTFADISSFLPAETRMYVPKVLATLQVREGVSLAELGPPRM
jgi:membrane-bound lytic murein transglycosylase D